MNNGAHDSVGGQPTVGHRINFPKIATASGYKYAKSIIDTRDIAETIREMTETQGAALLEIKVKKGNRPDLGRPTATPVENKTIFMDFLLNG